MFIVGIFSGLGWRSVFRIRVVVFLGIIILRNVGITISCIIGLLFAVI